MQFQVVVHCSADGNSPLSEPNKMVGSSSARPWELRMGEIVTGLHMVQIVHCERRQVAESPTFGKLQVLERCEECSSVRALNQAQDGNPSILADAVSGCPKTRSHGILCEDLSICAECEASSDKCSKLKT